jgi:uncharacterized repeat protein (TIGR01451 family)
MSEQKVWDAFLAMPETVALVKSLIGQNIVVTMVVKNQTQLAANQIAVTETLPEYSEAYGAGLEKAAELMKAHPGSSRVFALLAWQAGDSFDKPSMNRTIEMARGGPEGPYSVELDGKTVTFNEEMMEEVKKLATFVPKQRRCNERR